MLQEFLKNHLFKRFVRMRYKISFYEEKIHWYQQVNLEKIKEKEADCRKIFTCLNHRLKLVFFDSQILLIYFKIDIFTELLPLSLRLYFGVLGFWGFGV